MEILIKLIRSLQLTVDIRETCNDRYKTKEKSE